MEFMQGLKGLQSPLLELKFGATTSISDLKFAATESLLPRSNAVNDCRVPTLLFLC